MRAADFFKLPPLVRKKGFKIHIAKKTGYSRKLLPLLKRPAFIVGFIASLLMLRLLSSYIWTVSISYNGADDRQILLKLKEYGLAPGSKKSDIDEGLLKEQLILAVDKLSWMGIFITGSSAKITYQLKTPAPEIIQLHEPCSIYASKTAILTKLNVFQGYAAAKVGTTVQKGDLLVSSAVPVGESGYLYAHAMAEIEARTWYDLEARALRSVKKKVYTGKEFTKTYVYLGNKKINLDLGYRNIFDKYDIITNIRSFGENVPFSVVTETYREYTTSETPLDEAAESERLKVFLHDTVKSGLVRGEIVAERYSEGTYDVAVYAKIICECVEDIGLTVKDAGVLQP